MTILANYRGPATLLVTGSGNWPVEVDLVAEQEDDGLKHWHGSIQASEEATWAAATAQLAHLRLPDGRIGDFVLRSGEVSGSGRPPFGKL
ncbi:DUF4873 domain-containing protein [Micromonospora sp. NPDC047557]|uniref:DUF4873 domain-containing protein n=1 Tax=Micromonospora sp. NPDC047557 TaxID=3364250 RepID=UPI00371A8A85